MEPSKNIKTNIKAGIKSGIKSGIKAGASAPELDQWVRTISKMARKTPGGR